ncbi:MAG: SH3 domain-containing protein, partial [bacterium]|nr:SH3 domain-containing protein [bacterium]
KIAVLDFTGSEFAQGASDHLVSYLLLNNRGTSPQARIYQSGVTTKIYDVVERSQLNKIIEEQKFGQSGLIDDSQTSQLGKILGVNAIVSGSVSTGSSDTWTKEKRTVYRKEEDGGNYEILVDVLTRKVNASVKIRIVSSETGQILGSKEAHKEASNSKDKDQIDEIPSPNIMISECIDQSCWEILNYMAPCFELVERELAKIKAKELKDKAATAAELAESGDLDKSYTIYYSLYQSDQYNPEITYNLGILDEAVGNFADAKAMYESALTLKSDEKDYLNAAQRVARSLDYTSALEKLGISCTKHEWNLNESAVAAVMAQKILIKGGSSDRQEIRQGPDENSALLTKVPGGIELVLVEVAGDWFKVKLIDGKEGYIHKKFVKQ